MRAVPITGPQLATCIQYTRQTERAARAAQQWLTIIAMRWVWELRKANKETQSRRCSRCSGDITDVNRLLLGKVPRRGRSLSAASRSKSGSDTVFG